VPAAHEPVGGADPDGAGVGDGDEPVSPPQAASESHNRDTAPARSVNDMEPAWKELRTV
jgi:hypothetical protein